MRSLMRLVLWRMFLDLWVPMWSLSCRNFRIMLLSLQRFRNFGSRFLAQTLQPLTGKFESHISNSTDFIQKIQKIRLRPTYLLVSFQCRIPFRTSPNKRHINHKDTLNIKWSLHSREVPSDLISLIGYSVTTTYFFYCITTKEAAMGSPISPIIANIFGAFWERGPQKNIQKIRNLIDDIFRITYSWYGDTTKTNFINSLFFSTINI